MRDRMASTLSPEDNAIYEAYAMLMNSQSLIDGVIERIESGVWAQTALRDVIFEHARKFEDMEDSYLRERAHDIREIGRRILMVLQENGNTPRKYPSRTILVGDEIGATQLAEVPLNCIKGVISATGSSSSHVAILHALWVYLPLWVQVTSRSAVWMAEMLLLMVIRGAYTSGHLWS